MPEHLQIYQNDHALSRSFTYKHSTLLMNAIVFVRLGDASAEAYEKLDGLLTENLVTMAPYNKKRDGLGLQDRPAADPEAVRWEVILLENRGNGNIDGHGLEGLGAPLKNHVAGLPTMSRDKAPYEGLEG